MRPVVWTPKLLKQKLRPAFLQHLLLSEDISSVATISCAERLVVADIGVREADGHLGRVILTGGVVKLVYMRDCGFHGLIFSQFDRS